MTVPAGGHLSPIRGLRFTHPDFDTGPRDRGPGIAGVPARAGLVCTGTGRLEQVEGADLLRQSLLLLLSTYPGERVMRPDYGCELLTLAFATNDDTTAGLAIHYVRRAVERFEPRVKILAVDATRSADTPYRLDVVLEYQPRLGGPPESLTVGLPLMGEEN